MFPLYDSDSEYLNGRKILRLDFFIIHTHEPLRRYGVTLGVETKFPQMPDIWHFGGKFLRAIFLCERDESVRGDRISVVIMNISLRFERDKLERLCALLCLVAVLRKLESGSVIVLE